MSKKRRKAKKQFKPVGEGTPVQAKPVEKEPKKEKAPKPKVKPVVVKEKKRTSPVQYFNEVKLELKKVSWPSRPEVITATIIVVIVVIIFGIYTGLLDFAFSSIIKYVSDVFGKV